MARNVWAKCRGLLFLVSCLLLSVSLTSCYPEFKNPIPPPSELRADPQVLGTWVRTTDTSKEQLSIFQRSTGWIDAVYINDINSTDSQKGINVLVTEGYSTSVGKQKFLCLRFRKRDFEDCDEGLGQFFFYILNYETPDKDSLVMRQFSIRKVEDLIKEGKLKGQVVKRGQFVDEVSVTSSSDELVQVISGEGVGAFLGQGASDVLAFSRGTAQ